MLNENHWAIEDYRQRMTAKEWKKELLEGNDKIFVNGRLRTLVSKRLGYGVVEVYKEPLIINKKKKKMSTVDIDGDRYEVAPQVAGLFQAVSEERDELKRRLNLK